MFLYTVQHSPNIIKIRKYKSLVTIKPYRNYIFGILIRHLMSLLQFYIFPQSLLVICQLNHQRNVENVLQPFAKNERNQMSHVHRRGRRSTSRVKVKRFTRFVLIQYGMHVSVGEKYAPAQKVVHWLARNPLEAIYELLIDFRASEAF